MYDDGLGGEIQGRNVTFQTGLCLGRLLLTIPCFCNRSMSWKNESC